MQSVACPSLFDKPCRVSFYLVWLQPAQPIYPKPYLHPPTPQFGPPSQKHRISIFHIGKLAFKYGYMLLPLPPLLPSRIRHAISIGKFNAWTLSPVNFSNGVSRRNHNTTIYNSTTDSSDELLARKVINMKIQQNNVLCQQNVRFQSSDIDGWTNCELAATKKPTEIKKNRGK